VSRIKINVDGLCNSCDECLQACIKVSGADPGIFLVPVNESVYPTVCRHCKNAPCVDICETKALFYKDGLVSLDLELCIHCGLCILACPFGAIEMNLKNEPVKCNGCPSYQSPPCLAACPRGIISLTIME
jgi:anaerobic carbon-monoxide dehydrogenase iron sulfur subunit